jgi:crotonobetainyl-CoA:carnitine CoA-transferase CaiB-like acyl-CoA transferase
MCTLSGYGATGPYKDMPSHGVGFDAWGSCAPPVTDENGFVGIPPMPSVGTRTGAIWAAFAILAAVLRAQREGKGAQIDISQADCAAFTNWVVLEAYQAYKRPESEVTGNPSDGGKRRAPGTEGSKEGVRYQYYKTKDGHVLFMASEREFWENFCRGVGRADLYEKRPGTRYADHALGDHALRRELQTIFLQRTTAEWIAFGVSANTPIMVVHDGKSVLEDPHFKHRFPWWPADKHGTELLPVPVKLVGETLEPPRRAPTLGQHTQEILRDVLAYDGDRIAALQKAGALG